jgi:2-keto-4-pentenoate hydratase/2-oxohepta-3-ene-1,7-dioic acid hydratase in catechol pathway
MVFGRFERSGEIFFGTVEGNEVVPVKSIAPWLMRAERVDLAELRILAPIKPRTIVCVGLNYRNHAAELAMAETREPTLFLKPASCAVGPGDAVLYPKDMSARLDYEAELAVVIGRRCSRVSEAEAMDYVLGLTCANDVTARDLQPKQGQWTVAKCFDTFFPIGPFVVSGAEAGGRRIATRLNGAVVQEGNTSDLIFPVARLVSFVSRVMTLERWDVISTGTPAGVGPMLPGDQVAVEIEGIGRLENRIAVR